MTAKTIFSKKPNAGLVAEHESENYEVKGFNMFWKSTLISEIYLRNDVPRIYKDIWMGRDKEFQEFLKTFKKLCLSLRNTRPQKWSEESNLDNFIKKVMGALGWESAAQPAPWLAKETFTAAGSEKQKIFKPDILIVNDTREIGYIEELSGEAKLKEARTSSIIVLEAKKWGKIHPAKFSDFDNQCLGYMRLFQHRYSILTDGKTWRLFQDDLSTGSMKRCHQFDLGKLFKHVLAGLSDADDQKIFEDNAKYFYYFFAKKHLLSATQQPSFVDELIMRSQKYAEQVDADLRVRFVSAMAIACNGFKRAMGKDFNEDKIDRIRNVSESHIFNMLFMRFCESKNILPIRQNPHYRNQSLSFVIDGLDTYNPAKEKDDLNAGPLQTYFRNLFTYRSAGTDLHDWILRLITVLEEGLEHPDAKFSIGRFKETVYAEGEVAFLKKYKLNNAEITSLLFELTYIQDETQAFQQISYSFFAPQQLGSIYENFLEYKIAVADVDYIFDEGAWVTANLDKLVVKDVRKPVARKDSLYFTPNDADRAHSGTYYTPHFIVKFILVQCLGPKLAKLNAEDILKLKVCDPSMGSGHFLSAAVNFLAGEYLTKLKLDERGLNGEAEEDLGEAKLKILQHCIYGIDQNSRAVKLAKMSLWLESALPNRELDPLDSQIKLMDSFDLVKSKNWRTKLGFDSKFAGFDVIVGNPPWGSDLSNTERDTLAERMPEVGQGNRDSYKFFFGLGFRLLASKGYIGYLTPSSFLVQPRYSDLRKLIATNTTQIIVDCGDKIFGPDVTAPCAISIVQKGPATKSFAYFDISRAAEKSTALQGTKASLKTTFSKRFDIILDADSKAVSKEVKTFAFFVDPKDCGIKYQRNGCGLKEKGKSDLAQRIFYTGDRQDDRDRKFIIGKDIVAKGYRIEVQEDRYLRHDWASILNADESVYFNREMQELNSKILWRQTANRPIAAVGDATWFANTLQAGVLTQQALDLHFTNETMCCIMNSTWFRYLYCLKVREGKRAFPQVKLYYLKELPIPVPGINELDELSLAYQNLANDTGTMVEVDEVVFKMYGATPAQKSEARDFLAALDKKKEKRSIKVKSTEVKKAEKTEKKNKEKIVKKIKKKTKVREKNVKKVA